MPYCSHCGAEVKPEEKYCPKCGSALTRPLPHRRSLLVKGLVIGIPTLVALVLIALALYTPYQVQIVDVRYNIGLLPPRIDFVITLRNDGFFSVRSDAVLTVHFDNGDTREYYFDTVSVLPGGVGRMTASIPVVIRFGGTSPSPTSWGLRVVVSGPISSRTIVLGGEEI